MIGIFGGTFDPVHYGHLQTIAHVRNTLNLEQVRLVPLGRAVHREQPVATARQRLAMLQAATEHSGGLIVDTRELNRDGGSYTVDTLQSLQQDFPGKVFCLVIGTDAFNSFESWKSPQAIFSMAHLVVMQRPDTAETRGHGSIQDPFIEALLADRQVSNSESLRHHSEGKILLVQVPQIAVSATMIRQKRAKNEPISGLVPGPVENLIRQWQLYR